MKDAEWDAPHSAEFPQPSPPPTGRKGPVVLLVQPRPGRPLTLAALAQEVVGYHVHYVNRTRPCLGEGICTYCAEGMGRHWYGFLAGLEVRSGALVLAQISSGAWLGCPEAVNCNGHLRGLVIRLWRQGRANNGPMGLEIIPGTKAGDLPPSFDVQAVLGRIWGFRKDARVLTKPIAPPQLSIAEDPDTAGLGGYYE